MRAARVATYLALAIVVVLFVVTWLSIPGGRVETKNLTSGEWITHRIGYPARWFRFGLSDTNCTTTARGLGLQQTYVCGPPLFRTVSLHDVKVRVTIFYSGLAAAIILVGLAFGAARRPPAAA
jgi:hypothetical protein